MTVEIIGTPASTTAFAYCERSDIEDVYGAKNIEAWADLDNDRDAGKIAARVSRALKYAMTEINDVLRSGLYAVPFTAPVPRAIVDISALLAGVWLYENRGTKDFNPDTGRAVHRYEMQRKRAVIALKNIASYATSLEVETQVEVTPKTVNHASEISDC